MIDGEAHAPSGAPQDVFIIVMNLMVDCYLACRSAKNWYLCLLSYTQCKKASILYTVDRFPALLHFCLHSFILMCQDLSLSADVKCKINMPTIYSNVAPMKDPPILSSISVCTVFIWSSLLSWVADPSPVSPILLHNKGWGAQFRDSRRESRPSNSSRKILPAYFSLPSICLFYLLPLKQTTLIPLVFAITDFRGNSPSL